MNGDVDDKPIYLATIKNGTDEHVETLRNALERADIDGTIVVGDENLSLAKIPALDAFADELADRVAKRVAKVNG